MLQAHHECRPKLSARTGALAASLCQSDLQQRHEQPALERIAAPAVPQIEAQLQRKVHAILPQPDQQSMPRAPLQLLVRGAAVAQTPAAPAPKTLQLRAHLAAMCDVLTTMLQREVCHPPRQRPGQLLHSALPVVQRLQLPHG